jgi:hypothetical protein
MTNQYINAPVRLQNGFDVTGTMQGTFFNGASSTIFTPTTGTYFHTFTGTVNGNQYRSMLLDLSSELDNVGAFAMFDANLNRCVLQTGAMLTASFIGGANAELGRILGFTPNSTLYSNSAKQITASNAPLYFWTSTEYGFAFRGGDYQDRDLIEQRFADDGTPFTIRRQRVWNSQDFGFTYELQGNVFDRFSGSAGVSFTWERFINEAQKGKAFVVFHTGTAYLSTDDADIVMMLSKEGSRFKPEKEDELIDDYYKVETTAFVVPNVTRGFDDTL